MAISTCAACASRHASSTSSSTADTIGHYPSRSEALFAILLALLGAGYDDGDIARLCLLETNGISELPREKGPAWLAQELKRAHHKANSLTRQVEGEPENADDLMTDTIPSPRPIVEGLLHEGMLLFGGKSKRGKSWLMLDLALSVATGRPRLATLYRSRATAGTLHRPRRQQTPYPAAPG